MYGLGTIINTAAILLGGLCGRLFRRFLSESAQDTLTKVCGVSTLFIAVTGALEGMLTVVDGKVVSGGGMLVILCLAIGGFIGELLKIEDAFEQFGQWLKVKSGNAKDKGFVDAFVTASLTVCIGAMAIVGSIDSGLRGNHDTLFAKSLLDGVMSIALASTMGIGVMLSAVAVLIYQGGIALLAQLVAPLLTEAMITEMSAVGGLLITGIGINMALEKDLKVANLLPAIIVPFIYYPIYHLFGG